MNNLIDIVGSGGGGGGGCFRRGTLVQQEGGKSTPIELLKEGDEVLSFDEHGKICVSKVTKVHIHEDPQPILRVKFWRGEVFATPNHWVLNQYDAFSEIGRLTTEDALVDGMGQLRPIISAELIGSEPVYNLTVVPNHTFIANDIRVHNGGHRSRFPEIAGSGGGGGGKGGGRQAVEAPDSLQSSAMVSIVDLLGEGQIGGIVNNSASSIFINDTPIQNESGSVNFSGVSWQQRTGTPDQTPIEGFDDVATPIAVGVKIGQTTPYVFSVSSMAADSVRVIVSVPSLMRQDTSTGDLHGTEVKYSISVSVNGGAYINEMPITISGKTTSKYQKSTVIPLPKPANSISIRVMRITPDSTSAALNNELWLDSYAEVIESRLSYPNSALVGVRIDASQFSSIPSRSYLVDGLYIQVPSNYDAAAKTYSGIWNGTFKPAISSNPAWILYDVLTNKRYGLGGFISEDQIDKAMLYQLGKYCDERVSDGYGGEEPRFAINTAIQSTAEAYRLISDISSAFRGMTYWNGSQVSFTQDAPSDPTMIYSPANVVGGEFNYSGSARKDRHSVVHVTWNDPADKYRKQIEYVEDPELVRQLGVRKAEVIAFGCTSRGQANRAGRWVLYSERYESNIITFAVGIDSALAAPGDVIRIQDPTRAGKRMAGRIVSSTVTSVTLDAPVTISEANASISIRLPDGEFFDAEISNQPGTYVELNLNRPLAVKPLPGAMFIVIEQNLQPLLARVLSISPQGDGTYQISAVEHNPSKYASVDFNLSLEVPKTSSIKLVPQTPSALQLKETQYAVAPGVLGNKLHISWFGNSPKYELRWRIAGTASGNWSEVILSRPTHEIENVGLGGLELEIVGISGLYRSGTLQYSYSVQGRVEPCEPLSAFYATGEAMQIRLNWTYSATARNTESVEIWASSGANDVSVASRLITLPWPQDQYIDTGKGIGERIFYFARTKDRSGNYSSWSSAIGESVSNPSLLIEQLNKGLNFSVFEETIADVLTELTGPSAPITPKARINIEIAETRGQLTNLDKTSSDMQAALNSAQQGINSAKADIDATKIIAETVKVDIEGAKADINAAKIIAETANEAAKTAIASIQSAVQAANVVKEMNLERIDVNAISTAIKASEQNALSVIRSVLQNERTHTQVNGQLIPRVAVAEKNIEKTVTDLAAEVNARETIAAQLGNNIAALNVAVQTRATETEALAKDVQTLSVTLNETVQATITQERATRATETEALSSRIEALSASVVPEIQSRLLEESNARATADSAISSKLTVLEAKVSNDISAAILEEKNTRATQDSALATSISELNVKVLDSIAAISTEQQTRVAQDSALATQITQLQAKVNNDIAASIATESTTRANETSALATQITQLQAKVNNDIAASIASEATARADADSAQATKLSSLEAKTNQNEAAIKAEETARTTQNSAFATQLTELQAKVNNDIAASITTEATARADADSAQASKITALEAKTAGNEAAIINEQTSRTNADSALSSSITSLSARLDTGDFAAVKTKAEASVDKAGAKAEAESVLAASLATGELATVKQTAESKTTPAEATAAANQAITAALGGSGSLADIKTKALASVDAQGAKAEAEKVLSTSLATGELATIRQTAETATTPAEATAAANQAITAALEGSGALASIKEKALASVNANEAQTEAGKYLTSQLATPGSPLAEIQSKANAAVTIEGARAEVGMVIAVQLKTAESPLAQIASKANASVDKEGAKAEAEKVLSTSLATGELATIRQTAESKTTPAEATAAANEAITAALKDSGSLASIKEKALASVDKEGARTEAEKVLSTSLATGELATVKSNASTAVQPGSIKALFGEELVAAMEGTGRLATTVTKAESSVSSIDAKSLVENTINAEFEVGGRIASIKATADAAVTDTQARTIFNQELVASMGKDGKLAGIISKADASVDAAQAQVEAENYITAQLKTAGSALAEIQSKANASITEAQAKTAAEKVLQTQLDTPNTPLAKIKSLAETAVDKEGAKAATGEVIEAQIKYFPGSPLAQIKKKADASVDVEGARAAASETITAQLKTPGSALAEIQSKANAAATKEDAKSEVENYIKAQLDPNASGTPLAEIGKKARAAVDKDGAEGAARDYITAQLGTAGSPLAQIQSKANAAATRADAKSEVENYIKAQLDPHAGMTPLAIVAQKANTSVDKEGAKAAVREVLRSEIPPSGSAPGSLAQVIVDASATATRAENGLILTNDKVGQTSGKLGTIEAKYSIIATADGTYAGMTIGTDVSTVGPGGGSQVIFTADKFAVCVPYKKNTTTTPIFTTGWKYVENVGMQNYVGIDGNLIVDGTIAASALKVSTLSAISANIGTLRTATEGPRLEISSDSIRVYDETGLRVVIGKLT